MNLGTELTRYLAQGIDLQHRRLERVRYLTNGEPYQKQFEEIVKWKQDRRDGNLRSETVFPANWGTVYETADHLEFTA